MIFYLNRHSLLYSTLLFSISLYKVQARGVVVGVMHRVDVGGLIFVLREHHEKILEALEVLEQALSTENPDPEDILKLIRFAQHSVGSCHHSTEEYILLSNANRPDSS